MEIQPSARKMCGIYQKKRRHRKSSGELTQAKARSDQAFFLKGRPQRLQQWQRRVNGNALRRADLLQLAVKVQIVCVLSTSLSETVPRKCAHQLPWSFSPVIVFPYESRELVLI